MVERIIKHRIASRDNRTGEVGKGALVWDNLRDALEMAEYLNNLWRDRGAHTYWVETRYVNQEKDEENDD